jgi:hypothetical protein
MNSFALFWMLKLAPITACLCEICEIKYSVQKIVIPIFIVFKKHIYQNYFAQIETGELR